MQKSRFRKATELQKLPLKLKEKIVKEERENVRLRVAKCRQNKKKIVVQQSPPYKSRCSYGKAVARVERALPKSPRKKQAVLQKLFSKVEVLGTSSQNLNESSAKHNNALGADIINSVISFYEQDDISRQAPGIKVVTTVRNKDGSKQKMQIRHMYMSVLETYQLFCSVYGKIIGKSKFAELRPDYIYLSNKLPHNVCVCRYHENFIMAVNALHAADPTFPAYSHSFPNFVICENVTEKCWQSLCQNCGNKLKSMMETGLATTEVTTTWNIWKDDEGKFCKVQEKGTIQDLRNYILKIMPQFLEHCYIKKQQAASYKMQRENVSSANFDPKFALIQIDFSENYTCIAQDEIQSFHWAHPQISLFTVSIWHSGKHHPVVIASDNLDHTKYTVVPYLDKLLENLPPIIEEISIWSDGPSSQFKNKFIAASFIPLQIKHNKLIRWHYFATSHGKGAVDGIGGAIKRQIRDFVIKRKGDIFNATDFAVAAKEVSSVKVMLVDDNEFETRRHQLNLDDIFDNAPAIPGISKIHCMYVERDEIVTEILSQTMFDKIAKRSTTTVNEKIGKNLRNPAKTTPIQDNHISRTIHPEDIKEDAYVLVQFHANKKIFRYAAICQGEIEDDDEVKIMCLKICGTSGCIFRPDESDISYVNFDQIVGLLPKPTLKIKGNKVYYEFGEPVDVFEK